MNRLSPADTRTTRDSLVPPAAAADSSLWRTSQVAQREIRASSLTPRGGRSDKPFPIAEFQRAVLAVDFIGINQILIGHGFSQYEVNLIEGKAKLLSPTLIVSQDLLVDILLHTAIEKSFLDYLPALPPFTTHEPDKLAELGQIATAAFCRKMGVESFEVLRAVIKKYRPSNGEECIGHAYGEAQRNGQEMLANSIARAFKEYNLTDEPEDSDQKDGVEARPQPRFPAFQFTMALVNLSVEPFSRILTRHGWRETDLDIIKLYMTQLGSERKRFGQGLENCKSLSSLDDICSRLIAEGITNQRHSLLQIFPLLPAFDSFSADIHIQNVLKLAADSLCREPDDPFLIEMFSKLAAKYRPANLNEFTDRIRASGITEENMAKIERDVGGS